MQSCCTCPCGGVPASPATRTKFRVHVGRGATLQLQVREREGRRTSVRGAPVTTLALRLRGRAARAGGIGPSLWTGVCSGRTAHRGEGRCKVGVVDRTLAKGQRRREVALRERGTACEGCFQMGCENGESWLVFKTSRLRTRDVRVQHRCRMRLRRGRELTPGSSSAPQDPAKCKCKQICPRAQMAARPPSSAPPRFRR